jgi:hypothetical protein
MNNFIGEEVTLVENSVCGYKMMGFQKIAKMRRQNYSI